MSVIATYARLDSNNLENCRTDPRWMEHLYKRSFPNSEVIDIDKACDGIVWILSRLPSPQPAQVAAEGFVLCRSLAPLLRGEDATKERKLDAPYGPASSLSTQQVAELSAWLQSIDAAQMRFRYNPSAMDAEDIYPNIWTEEGAAAFEQYLLPSFEALKAFLSRAAAANQQVLVFFT